jgi:hypothetical protein
MQNDRFKTNAEEKTNSIKRKQVLETMYQVRKASRPKSRTNQKKEQ